MNNNSTDSIPLKDKTDESQRQLGSLPPLLPRSAWKNQLAYLKFIFKAKRALDQIEEAVKIEK
ncbi:MAG: hypothetical protein AAF378_01280 [Cyanobacteria bacterium P01_A01_bin.84]